MLKDVVQVCTDGSDLSHKGIESAVEIAKALHLPVVGMTAVLSKPNTSRAGETCCGEKPR